MTTDVAAALVELEALDAKPNKSDDDKRRFNQLQTEVRKAMDDTTEVLDQPERVELDRDPPRGALRSVVPAVRSLADAVRKDGRLATLHRGARIAVDVPVDIRVLARAVGSTQADGADPAIAVQPQNLGLINTYHGIANRLVSALSSIPVSSNAVVYTRLTYAAAVGSPSQSGNASRKVQELTLKPQSTLSSEEVTQVLETYAHWIPASRQVLDDVAGLRSLIDVLLVSGLLDNTDASVYTAMTTAGRYTAFSPTASETVGDGIARAASNLLEAGATSVKVAVNPGTYLASQLTKASGSGIYLGLPPGLNASIVTSASVAAGKILAWADTGAVWANREGVSVNVGWQNDDFTSNRVTILAEHRGAVLTLDARHVLFGNATA